jgi:signal transduction histidine kinase
MAELIDDLLDLSRVGRRPLRRETVDLSALAFGIAEDLKGAEPEREVDFVVEGGVTARGDVGLLKAALENLLGNAWKFTSREPRATIRFGASGGPTTSPTTGRASTKPTRTSFSGLSSGCTGRRSSRGRG